jgi:3-oxoacyl-[acyl-carrier protein] reductase
MAEKRLAVVTGAARGIGKGIVLALLEQEREVAALDFNAEQLDELKSELASAGSSCQTHCVDITDTDRFVEVLTALSKQDGGIGILVNNAGITRDNIVVMMSDDDWDLVLKVNLKSAFIGTREAGKVMMRQRCGSIINMSSYSGLEGNRGQGNYAAAKAGMIGLSKSAAKELAKRAVRVNCVCPGFIQTEMTDVLPQQAKDMALAMIPMQKMGQPSDIAKAVTYLATDASVYVTGQTLSVDGGMHM